MYRRCEYGEPLHQGNENEPGFKLLAVPGRHVCERPGQLAPGRITDAFAKSLRTGIPPADAQAIYDRERLINRLVARLAGETMLNFQVGERISGRSS
jgi:hypothetical protein